MGGLASLLWPMLTLALLVLDLLQTLLATHIWQKILLALILVHVLIFGFFLLVRLITRTSLSLVPPTFALRWFAIVVVAAVVMDLSFLHVLANNLALVNACLGDSSRDSVVLAFVQGVGLDLLLTAGA